MNRIDEHELQAWVDGELAPADAERVAAAVAADPGLARRAEHERRLRRQLRAEFDAVLDEPVPPHLLAMLRTGAPMRTGSGRDDADGSSDTSPDLPPAVPVDRVVPMRPRVERPARRWSAPVYALAASLAVLAAALWLRPAGGPVRLEGDALVARGELADALDTGLAGAPRADARLAIGVTFRDTQGRVCRSFVQHAEPALAGLACREAGRWTLPVLSRPEPTAAGELRQAASGMPPEVQVAIDARLEGDTFDADEERAAREAGWR